MPVIPDAHQFRAARHLLDLSQKAVGVQSSIAYATVQTTESGLVEPTITTVTKLREFYEARGIEFAEGGWVRLSNAVTRKTHQAPT